MNRPPAKVVFRPSRLSAFAACEEESGRRFKKQRDFRRRSIIRKTINHPSEIPEFASTDEFRNFWDRHEMGDYLIALYLESEKLTLTARDGILLLEIINIPTNKLFNGDEMTSSWQEDHVKNRLEMIKQRIVHLLQTTALPQETHSIQVDFRTMKVIKRPGSEDNSE